MDSIDRALEHIQAARIRYCMVHSRKLGTVANLPDTFEGFERRAGERFDRFVAAGTPLEKVLIDVDVLAAWCRELGRPVDSRARAAFAAVTLARRDSQAGNA